MTRMIELTDLMFDDTEPTVVPVDQVGATVREWYPPADYTWPSELEKIDELQAALLAQDDELARQLAAELGVSFDEVAEQA